MSIRDDAFYDEELANLIDSKAKQIVNDELSHGLFGGEIRKPTDLKKPAPLKANATAEEQAAYKVAFAAYEARREENLRDGLIYNIRQFAVCTWTAALLGAAKAHKRTHFTDIFWLESGHYKAYLYSLGIVANDYVDGMARAAVRMGHGRKVMREEREVRLCEVQGKIAELALYAELYKTDLPLEYWDLKGEQGELLAALNQKEPERPKKRKAKYGELQRLKARLSYLKCRLAKTKAKVKTR